MKIPKLYVILFLGMLTTLAAPAQDADTKDSIQLLHFFQSQTELWMEAYNSRDAKNLIPLYATEARYVSSHVAGLVADGRDKLIANFQHGMSGGGHIDQIDILSMNLSCELATLFCRYQATNSGQTVSGRNLLVMKKINGRWLIVLHMTVI